MKTETKVEATPGPWETRKPRTPQDLVSHYVQSESANLAICKILKDQYRTNEEAEANAKLIAAAPDLLSSIQLALTYLEDGAKNTAIEILQEAIKKATE